MLSRLHGEANCMFVKSEWIPLAHGVMSASIIFNWASILSANILRALEKAIQRPDVKGTPFYFSSFLLDALCASNQFPALKWAWTPKCPPIHIYCQALWRENYYREMYDICNHFMAPAHKMIFGVEMPRISEVGREAISETGNWYLLKNFTYIRIVGILVASNMLPKYVPNQILLKEFAFQIFEIGHTVSLIRRKVKAWPEMPISVGSFQLLNHGHARKELEDYLDYRWLPTTIRRHDLKGLIAAHFKKLGLVMQYRHGVSR